MKNSLFSRVISLVLAVVMFAGCFGSITFTQAAGATVYKPLEEQGFAVVYSGGKFNITRTKTDEAVSVNYRTLSGSAVAGVHFTAKSGTLEFGVNEGVKTVSVDETAVGTLTYYIDRYQMYDRTYSLEVYNDYGDRLAIGDRSITYSGYKVSSSMYDEKSLNVSSSSITVNDNGYGQGYHSVPISNFFSNTAPYIYFNAVGGVHLRMTLDMTVKEKDDGYQYVQILADQTSNYDGKEKADQATDGDPGKMSISKYMAGFGHDPGDKNSNTARYSFPVKSAGNNCGAIETPWNVSPYNNSLGKLYTQKFNNNRATDGRIMLPLNVSSLGVRFDASGNNEDTWYASDVKAKIEAVDTTKPSATGAYATAGEYKANDIIRVSVRFSEIVKVVGSSPVLKTSIGNLTYAGGSGTNVLYFEGPASSEATRLQFNGFTNASNIQDYDGNSYTYVSGILANINNVSSRSAYTITYRSDYGERIQYVKRNTFITLPQNIFNNVPEYLEPDYWTVDTSSTHYETKTRYEVNSDYVLTLHWKYKKYRITFKHPDGAALYEADVAYNSTPVYRGTTPSKPSTDEYSYTFDGWYPALGPVKGDTEYTAVFKSEKREYPISFRNYDNTPLYEGCFEYGEMPEYKGQTPERPADGEYTYTFSRWSPALSPVTGSRVYTAVFVSSKNSYTVTFKDYDGKTIKSEVLEYGVTPEYTVPTREQTDTEVYTFDHWTTDPSTGEDDFTTVKGDTTYYAVYRTETRYYTVVFQNNDNSILTSQSYEYGQTPEYTGETPTKNGYGSTSFMFKGWNKEFVPVTCDTVYEAIYYTNKVGSSGGIDWSLYCDTLTISPVINKGYMIDYIRETSVPWNAYRDQIKHLIIEDGVTEIGQNAFKGLKNLTDASIPISVTKIGEYAFYDCVSLQSIKIPYGVTSIGIFAFYRNDSLKSVYIPGTVECIYTLAFSGCENLENVTIADGVSYIDTEAFSNCGSLKNITIPGSVEYIGYRAFYCCPSLESAVMEYGVKTIDGNVFENCSSLESVVIPESVTSIGEYSFNMCYNLKNITLPSGIEELNCKLFYGCDRLESMVIPEGVKTISDEVFSCCVSLSEITLPSTLQSIGDLAFYGCSQGLTVYYNGSEQTWNNISFTDLNSTGLPDAVIEYLSSSVHIEGNTDFAAAEADRYFVYNDDGNRTVTVTITKIADGCTVSGISAEYTDENSQKQTLAILQKSENVYTFDIPVRVHVNVTILTEGEPATALQMGENTLSLTTDEKVFTFTPETDGWYAFDAPDEDYSTFDLENSSHTLIRSKNYMGEGTYETAYLFGGETYTVRIQADHDHVGYLTVSVPETYKISIGCEHGTVSVTTLDGIPVTDAPYMERIIFTPYPDAGYTYDDTRNDSGRAAAEDGSYIYCYGYNKNIEVINGDHVTHYKDFVFYMPASPVTVSVGYKIKNSINLIADEGCYGLMINDNEYSKEELRDLNLSDTSNIWINDVLVQTDVDYDNVIITITDEGGNTYNLREMISSNVGQITVTVTTSRLDFPVIEQLNTAYGISGDYQYFKFTPSEDGLYKFSSSNGDVYVYSINEDSIIESGEGYPLFGGQTYFIAIYNGDGGEVTSEKIGAFPGQTINVEGGSYLLIHYKDYDEYTAYPLPGYRFVHWEQEDNSGFRYTETSITTRVFPDFIISSVPVFEKIAYYVIFADDDGRILQKSSYYYGDTPVYTGAAPAKTVDGFTYTSSGWNTGIKTVADNAVYFAVYHTAYDPVLGFGDSYVRVERDFTQYTFTPDESGWYTFSLSGELTFVITESDIMYANVTGTDIVKDVYLKKDKTYTVKVKLNGSGTAFVCPLNIDKTSETHKLTVEAEHGTVLFTTPAGDVVTEAPEGARITGIVYPDSGYIYLEKRIKYIKEGHGSTTAAITDNGFTITSMPACALTFKPVFERKYMITFEHDDGCYALKINGSENYYLTNEDLRALEIKSSFGLGIYPMLYNDRELDSFAVYDKDNKKLTDDNAYWFDTLDDGITIPDGICRVVVTTKKRSTSSDPFITELAFDPDQTESFIEYTVTEPTVFSFSPAENGFYKFFLNEDATPVQNLIYHSAMGNKMLSSSGIDELNGVNLPTDFRFGLYADQTYYLRVSSGTLKIEKVDTSDVLPSVTVENAEHGDVVYAKYSAYGSIILDLAAITDPGYRFVRWDISKNGNVVTTKTENPAFYVSTANDNVPVTVTPVFEKVTYTVIFADDNGNILQIGEYEYGETPVYSGVTPVKPDAANATFEFTGWEGGITAVTENKIYRAKFRMNASDVLGVGDNYIVSDIPDNPYYFTFTPENDGWYSFSSADHIESGFEIYDGYNEIYPETLFIYDDIYFSAYLYGGKTYTISAIIFDDPCIAVLTVTKDPEMHKITLSVRNGVAAVTDYYGNTVTEAPQGAILRLKAYPETGYYWDMNDTSYNLPYVITTGGDDYTAFYMPGSAVAVTVSIPENNGVILTVNADEGFDNLQIGLDFYTSCKDPIEISDMYYSDVTVTIKPLYTIDSVTVKDSDGNDVIYEIENSLMGTRLTFYLEKSTVINLKTSKIASSELLLGQPTPVENDASAFTFVPEQTGLYHFEAEAGYLYVLGSDYGVNNNNGNFYLIKNQTYDVIVEDCGGKYLSVSLTEVDRNPINVTSTEGGNVIYDHSDEDSIELYALPDEGYHLIRWEFRNDDGYQTCYRDDNYFFISCNPTYVNAVFAKNEYSVMFADENGFVLQKSQVQTGEMPVYTGEPLTKQSSDQNVRYTFAGWSKPIAPATEDVIYKAVFDEQHHVLLSATSTFGNVQITPDGDLFTGDTVTLTAEEIDGCGFLGWYDGDTKVCDTLIYRFVITKETHLTAKYGSVGKASVTVNTVCGAKFSFGDGLYYAGRTISIKSGSVITLYAEDESKVLQWENASGKVLGRGSSLTLTVTGNMSVTLVYKAEGQNSSYVQFVSSFGQVLSAKLYETGDNVLFPVPPTKLGYTFTNWVLTDGDKTYTINEGNIKDYFSTNSVMTLTPQYVDSAALCRITVQYAGADGRGADCIDNIYTGSGYTVKAPSIAGYTFHRWIVNGKAASYKPEYYIQLREDITLTAEYVTEGTDVSADAEPVITISALKKVTEGTAHKVTASATRSITDGCTLIEHGILYVRANSKTDEAAMEYGKCEKYISNKTAQNGVVKLNVSVTDDNTVVTMRGYMILEDENHNRQIFYTDIVYGSFNTAED